MRPSEHPRFDEFREYICDLGGYCRNETYHGEYATEYIFEDEACKDDDAAAGDGMATYATVKFDTVYLKAYVTIYPAIFEYWLNGKYKDVGRMMLHEMCHGFIEPIKRLFWWDVCNSQKSYYCDTIERQVQRMAYTVFDLLPKEWYLPENLKRSQS